jgi:hypothetical protein
MNADSVREGKYYSEMLCVLSLDLIEIGATEDLQFARIMADIFHNVPEKISAGSSNEEIGG